MAQVVITINYREYAISCENGEELQIMKLGRILDEKAKSLTQALGPVNENMLLAMVGLLVADELSEAKKTIAAANTAAPAQPAEEKTTVTSGISEATLTSLDDKLAEHIDSLNSAIKSIALKLNSL